MNDTVETCFRQRNDGRPGEGRQERLSAKGHHIQSAALTALSAALFCCAACAAGLDSPVDSAGPSTGSGGGGAAGGSAGAPEAAQIAVGPHHGCALMADGSVRCWGSNEAGQLGDGTNGLDELRLKPTPVVGLTNIAAISAGGRHTCAVNNALEGGGVRCWGSNDAGQLGVESVGSASTPIDVPALANVAEIALGGDHTCARLNAAAGEVWCWGANDAGQLGDGTTIARSVPTLVAGVANVMQLSLGKRHSCALHHNQSLTCWGANESGQLGIQPGSLEDEPSPALVINIEDATHVALGGAHNCTRCASGKIQCWGANGSGQLGDGSTTNNSVPPLSFIGTAALAEVAEVTLGGEHTCVRLDDSGLLCWGNNAHGQLGDGTTDERHFPPFVALLDPLLHGTVQLAFGEEHSCARLQTGAVTCWGRNQSGELGDGTTTERHAPTALAW